MILDRLDNWALYCTKDSHIARAMRFLTHEFDASMPDGRLDVDGDNVFALIQGYETRPVEQCRFEAHRVYLDIQYVVDGAEVMGWTPAHELEVEQDYDESKDILFYRPPARFTSLEVFPGSFALFYPGDAHQPGMRLSDFPRVRKVVMKVRV